MEYESFYITYYIYIKFPLWCSFFPFLSFIKAKVQTDPQNVWVDMEHQDFSKSMNN